MVRSTACRIASSSARSRAPAAFPPTTGACPVVTRLLGSTMASGRGRRGGVTGAGGGDWAEAVADSATARPTAPASEMNDLFIAAPSERNQSRAAGELCGQLGPTLEHQPSRTIDPGRASAGVSGGRTDPIGRRPKGDLLTADHRPRRRRQVGVANGQHRGRRLGLLEPVGEPHLHPDHRPAVRLVLHVHGARPVERPVDAIGIELVPAAGRQAPQRGSQPGGGRRAGPPLGARARQIDAGHPQIGGRPTGGGDRSGAPVDGHAVVRVEQIGGRGRRRRRRRGGLRGGDRRQGNRREDQRGPTPTRSSRAASTRCRRRRG